MRVIIDTTKIAEHAARLEMIGKAALPVAVRQTLNKAAYDVKTNTMPATSGADFIHRNPTFFKANSKVVQATGVDIENMRATIGFLPKTDAKDSSVSDLEQQENGGAIDGRAFIPLAQDRTGNSWQRNVRKAGRWRALQGRIFDSKDAPGSTDAERYVQTAIEAAKVGGIVIGNKQTKRGNKIAWQVQHLNRFNSNTYIVATPLFAVKSGREVMPPATHFMRTASLETQGKMEGYFILLAEKKINSIK